MAAGLVTSGCAFSDFLADRCLLWWRCVRTALCSSGVTAALAFIAFDLVSTLASALTSAAFVSALTPASGFTAVVDTLVWLWSALITGAVVVVLPASAAKAGAAITEAASKAAEMVFNMVGLLLEGS